MIVSKRGCVRMQVQSFEHQKIGRIRIAQQLIPQDESSARRRGLAAYTGKTQCRYHQDIFWEARPDPVRALTA